MLSERQKLETLRAFSTALKSGISLHELLSNPQASAALPSALRTAVADGLERGESLTAALGKFGGWSDAELALLAAGERSGDLVRICKTLVDAIETRRRDRRRLGLALAYPALIFLAAGCLLPATGVLDHGLDWYLARASIVPVLLVALAVYAFVIVPRLPLDSPLRALPGRVALHIPLLGRGLARGTHGAFADVLGRCLDAGLPLPQALRAATSASANPAVSDRGDELVGAIADGRTLSDALLSTGLFGGSFIARVAQGEMTGTLVETLAGLAKDEKAAGRTALIAGLVTVVILVLVLAAAIAVWGIVQGASSYVDTIDDATRIQ